MATLYSLVKESKSNPEALEEVIEMFGPKVSKAIAQTSANEKDDLSQELKILLMKCIQLYDLDNVPGFWEFKDKLSKRNSS
ncbi:helix-turn-helix domain-containing protein [Niallia taxi]|uniref:helix-turn-helix domain-containing protein n=1 Tax=Niallia taxi TaxID=2499688 RepID=UPI002E203FD0|nr:helix-turn-helix domain-containing protein [Niallia taxi]MED4120375.1 helix-turn-helix domain-containing protein [Niallia taxi]